MSVKITTQEELDFKDQFTQVLLYEYLKITNERKDSFIASIKALFRETVCDQNGQDEKLKELLENLLEENNKTREIQQKFFSNIKGALKS